MGLYVTDSWRDFRESENGLRIDPAGQTAKVCDLQRIFMPMPSTGIEVNLCRSKAMGSFRLAGDYER
jgi:hypothetical protein